MPRNTTSLGVQVPTGPDANNVPQDLGYIADYLDANPGISRLTSTQIGALTAAQKPAGRVVYDTTLGKLRVSDGSTFGDVAAAGLSLATTPPTTITPDDAAAVGTGTTAAKADHQHAIAAAPAVSQEAGGANTEGISTSFARADHTHEHPVAAPATIVPAGSSAQGSSTSFARADHVHAVATAAGSTIQPDDAAATGTATSFSRSDHKHAVAADAPTTALTATTSNAEGSATSFSRSDHTHAVTTAAAGQITAGATAAAGSGAPLARADHVHSVATAAAGQIQAGATAAEGSSSSLARADHVHSVATGTAVALGAAAAEGSSTSVARADHVHPYPSTLADDPTLTRPLLAAPQELVTVNAGGMGATVNLDAKTAGVLLYTGNATANSTLNIRGDGSTSLSSLLAVGESVTVTLLNTNGATACRPTAFQIDGSSVTPKWSGGSAPTAGNANSVDAYQLTIIKTAATPTYTVLATAGRYA